MTDYVKYLHNTYSEIRNSIVKNLGKLSNKTAVFDEGFSSYHSPIYVWELMPKSIRSITMDGDYIEIKFIDDESIGYDALIEEVKAQVATFLSAYMDYKGVE